MRYFVTTKISPGRLKGRLRLTADEALRFVQAAEGDGIKVEIRDENDKPVSVEQLKRNWEADGAPKA